MFSWLKYTLLLTGIICLCSCAEKDAATPPLFQKMDPEMTGIHFQNTTSNSEDFNIFNYRNFYNGGGVAIADFNNDDLPDVYLTNNTSRNALFLNKGDFHFEDITEASGAGGSKHWSTGVAVVDINADGLLDIYVCNAGYKKGEAPENELFINNGDLTFTEKAAEYGLNENGYTTHTAFFDYDLDGDLDAYILNNSFIPANTLNYSNQRDLPASEWDVKDFLKGGGDKLLRNDDGMFHDVSKAAGIYSSLIGFGLGVTVGDVNGDLLPDLYVSNDFYERDYLYINNGDGTFKEDLENMLQHISLSSMGADMADINNDGYPEIFVTDMLPADEYRLKTTTLFENYQIYAVKTGKDFYHQYMQNTLHLNNRDKTFSEIAFYSDVAASDWSWGALMFDMDNDGLRDLYVCNGIFQDVTDQDFIDFFANEVIQKMALTGEKEQLDKVIERMPSNPVMNRVFRNIDGLRFEDVSKDWGFSEPTFSNGAAYGDLDNDGDLDLIINNLNQPVSVFQNSASDSTKYYISVHLKGTGKNTFAIGSKVNAYSGEQIFSTELIPTRGFQSSVDYEVLMAIGKISHIDSLVVFWPNRTKTILTAVPLNTIIDVDQNTADILRSSILPADIEIGNQLLQQVPLDALSHKEDQYVDFYNEGLLTKMLSREGPAFANGDINGDGLEDFFIGGAAFQSAQVFLQTNDGLIALENIGLYRDRGFEDVAAALFDADGDGDMDLYIGSGGNHQQAGTRLLQDRLYKNDGTGQFSLDVSALPVNGMNTSVVIPFDHDKDGDIDLFVGSRNIPNNYGVNPRSYLFENDGKGKYSDVTKAVAPELEQPGMVTDAVLADVVGDQEDELIIVGEWMSPQIFEVGSRKISRTKSNLDALSGWWLSVEAADLNQDGKQDLILGNQGQNFYLKASEKSPLRLWVSDFDNNGTVENILSRTIDGKNIPVPLKKELTEQLPYLKKQNIRHVEFANKTMEDLFGNEVSKNGEIKKAVELRSMIAYNNGEGSFKVEALPAKTQLSCICDIACSDLNADGFPDLILGGNHYGFTPQFSRQDGSFGHVLMNQKDGTFSEIPSRESGFKVFGEIRHISPISINGQPHFLVLRNNGKPLLYKFADPIEG